MADSEFLDGFERTLEDGLIKVCNGSSVLGTEILGSPDIDEAWNGSLIEGYVGDAVNNFNEYPQVALAWAAYLGMGVACNWDKDWAAHKSDTYKDYYGPRGYDDMDEHIVGDILHLTQEHAGKLVDVLYGCADLTLSLIRHEEIEPQTARGFYVLVRAYSVFFRLGAAIELYRQGYRKTAVNPKDLLKA